MIDSELRLLATVRAKQTPAIVGPRATVRHATHITIQWSMSWTTGRRQPPRSQLLEPLCRPSAVDLDGTKLHVLITSNDVRQPRDLGGELDGLW